MAPETNGKTDHEDKIAIDIDDEYGDALNGASQEEIIDLAGILLFIFLVNFLFIVSMAPQQKGINDT